MTSNRFAVAVHILTVLSSSGEQPVTSEELARSVNTNPVVVRRILGALAKAKLVVSQSGAAGGSRLAQRADEIALLDVYRAVEPGALFGLHQPQPGCACFVGRSIRPALGTLLGEAQTALEQVLARQTVADVFTAIKECAC